MTERIALLIPEFPGQTHNFFWEEVRTLESLGAAPLLLSTRRPPSGVQSPDWADQAVQRTHYLWPLRRPAAAVLEMLRRPMGLLDCLREVIRADLPDARARLRMLALVLVAAECGRWLRARKVDHLHVHSAAEAAHLALLVHRLTGMPYSLTLHGDLSGYGPNQPAKWRAAAFGIVVSAAIQRSLAAGVPVGLPPLLRAPMGVNTHFFSRSAPYKPWQPGERLQLFSCARLNRHKGHLDALTLVQGLRQQGWDVTLQIAGEDDAGGTGFRKVLEQRIQADGLQHVVQLLGAVPADMVRAALQSAHVFVLLTHDEALGVAYMEAMAMQVPVLGCNVGGVAELITDGAHGVLVPAGQPGQALVALTALLTMPGERLLGMGREARARVAATFNSGLSARTLLDGVRGPAVRHRPPRSVPP